MIEEPADNNNMISNEPENVLRVNNNNNQQNPNSQSSRNPELPQSGRYQSNRNQDQVQRRSNFYKSFHISYKPKRFPLN